MKILIFMTIMSMVCTSLLPVVGLGASFQQIENHCKDHDQDQLCLKEELDLGTDPYQADTDQDGLSDGEEVSRGTNPLKKDTDGDQVIDSEDFLPWINNSYVYQVCAVLIIVSLGVAFLFQTPRRLKSLENLMSKLAIPLKKQEKKETRYSISKSKDLQLENCKDCEYLKGFEKEEKHGYTIITPKCDNICGKKETIIDLDNSNHWEV